MSNRRRTTDHGEELEDHPDKPTTSSSTVQDQLDGKLKLADAKEFHIQGIPNGKILGCGVIVRSFGNYEFRVRIYNGDRNNSGRARKYIEMSLDTFLSIKQLEDTIKSYLNDKKLREGKNIFEHNNLSVKIVRLRDYDHSVVKFAKEDTAIYMNNHNFSNLMVYDETLKKERMKCQKRCENDKKFLDELVNVMSYHKNNNQTNEFITKPAVWYKSGVPATWIKFMNQITNWREKMAKRAKLNDD